MKLHRRRKEMWTELDRTGIHVCRRTGGTTSGLDSLTAEQMLCWFLLCGGFKLQQDLTGEKKQPASIVTFESSAWCKARNKGARVMCELQG